MSTIVAVPYDLGFVVGEDRLFTLTDKTSASTTLM